MYYFGKFSHLLFFPQVTFCAAKFIFVFTCATSVTMCVFLFSSFPLGVSITNLTSCSCIVRILLLPIQCLVTGMCQTIWCLKYLKSKKIKIYSIVCTKEMLKCKYEIIVQHIMIISRKGVYLIRLYDMFQKVNFFAADILCVFESITYH